MLKSQNFNQKFRQRMALEMTLRIPINRSRTLIIKQKEKKSQTLINRADKNICTINTLRICRMFHEEHLNLKIYSQDTGWIKA